MEGNSFLGSEFPFWGVYPSAGAAIMESHRPGSFHHTNVIYPGSGRPGSRCRQGWCLARAAFSLRSSSAWRENRLSGVSSYKDVNPVESGVYPFDHI